jgi:lipopolysaccharide transport system ATP-binding protein
MHEPLAIRLRQLSKTYRLYGSQREQLFDLLGLARLGLVRQKPIKEFRALDDVSLDVPRGHRIGVVGRNGAGKTTLLKLICGNFAPTSGEIEVRGTVQALFGMGLGFHPEFTGIENIRSSLQYNGLSKWDYDESIRDIIDFCELGEFIDQPLRTYSLGMQARLMFATATAIKPDILIVDEVLGAGDAYFIAKSKHRVERLVSNGCTLLLVSHSTQQVLELCTDAIWLDHGRIRMQGDAFLVIKAYEECVHGPSSLASFATSPANLGALVSGSRVAESRPLSVNSLGQGRAILLQEPHFLPHAETPQLPEIPASDATVFRFEARGGLSRWASEVGLKVCGFTIATESGIGNVLLAMRPAKIVFFLVAEREGEFDCRYGIAIHDLKGTCITRIFGPADQFRLGKGCVRQIEVVLNPNQIGPGQYTLGISVLGNTPVEQVNAAIRYDLLGRSFCFEVQLPDSLAPLESGFVHSAEWRFWSLDSSQ